MTLAGSLLFARYAYPPNALGYCGPPDPAELLGATLSGDRDGLGALAPRFEGAWPYLELIAGCNRIADPLDRRVVEAYWVGNRLLERVPAGALGSSVEQRFARRAGPRRRDLLGGAAHLGGTAHHSFHVFAVYPWLGLLRAGRSVEPLAVLDRCRIRWGRVDRVEAGQISVRNRTLRFDGHRLELGAELAEAARVPADQAGRPGLAPGDMVSLHWDWVCQRLSPAAVARLERYTARTLAAVNALPVPGPLVACESGGSG